MNDIPKNISWIMLSIVVLSVMCLMFIAHAIEYSWTHGNIIQVTNITTQTKSDGSVFATTNIWNERKVEK